MPKTMDQKLVDRVEAMDRLFQKAGIDGSGAGSRFCHVGCLHQAYPANRRNHRAGSNVVVCKAQRGKEVYIGSTVCERDR